MSLCCKEGAATEIKPALSLNWEIILWLTGKPNQLSLSFHFALLVWSQDFAGDCGIKIQHTKFIYSLTKLTEKQFIS